ncbi:Helix-turn-helix type 3 [Penicillium angulare]|uniref:Helix-turn-helix type 3 n=1 Tax=Penicillium angulare TaxID=116970 RepID=UPI0025411C47|nr:Helix-turn-helix type 3 [Penicillium angulare]KAJ5289108.1 Helix-turn-helix type 3 [Penicillium angulare]
MSDWETTTKIGSKYSGAGAAPRESTIKGKSALNAAQRSGAVLSTEKKYATGNAIGKGVEGQHLTKVDRTDDTGKIDTVGPKVADIVRRRRVEMGFKTQRELATKTNIKSEIIGLLESGNLMKTEFSPLLNKLQSTLQVKLSGNDIGGVMEKKQFKRNNNPAKK